MFLGLEEGEGGALSCIHSYTPLTYHINHELLSVSFLNFANLVLKSCFHVPLGKHHLIKLMNLLASSNAFVHINKIGASSPFKAYVTINKNKPATTLNKEKALTKECRYSMPSTLGQKCFMSATFAAAKVSTLCYRFSFQVLFTFITFEKVCYFGADILENNFSNS